MTIENAFVTPTATAKSSKLKRNLAYWVPTALLAFVMGSGGVVDAFQLANSVEIVNHLGYPAYFCSALGVAKLLGTAALLIPGSRTLREWAYAGFTFDVLAAAVSVAVVDHTSSPFFVIALALIYFSRREWLKRA